jgi:protein O-mannosyl-transferase
MASSPIPWFSLLIAGALLLATLGLYRAVLEQGFVHFDDDRYVTENRAIQHGVDAATIAWAFTTDRMGTWHPLTWLSHAIDWSLYGPDAGGHHLTSLLLHAFNALLLFGVLRWMTGSVGASAFVAFVFAVHPLNVDSVAWISSRKGVLSMAFWLLTVAAYTDFAKRGGSARYLLVLVAFALGLMSKPAVVSLPLVLLLLDVWPLGRMGWNGKATGEARPFIEKIPLFVMALASSLVAFAVRRIGDPVAWTDRWARVPIAYVLYLKRIFWPAGLATPYPPSSGPTAAQVLPAIIVLLGITAFAIQSHRTRPYVTVGWLWFVVTLAPVIGFVQIGAHPMADRWTYLPMIGVLIAVAWGVPSALPASRFMRVTLGAAGVSVVAALVLVTRAQIGYWQDTETLFRRAIAVTEDNRTAHYNLAWYLSRQDRPDEAVEEYRRAIEIDPDHFPSHHNLALLLIAEGRAKEAVEPLCAALRLTDPGDEALRQRLTEHLHGTACR